MSTTALVGLITLFLNSRVQDSSLDTKLHALELRYSSFESAAIEREKYINKRLDDIKNDIAEIKQAQRELLTLLMSKQ